MMDERTRYGLPRRPKWHTIGLYLTAFWLIFVVAYTMGDRTHPLFEHIFTAPLAAWIVAILIARLIRRRRGGD